tara:strand:+ start:4486 stop:4854 length:369 start_codon:yes stop_codon:yes gene_type:complete
MIKFEFIIPTKNNNHQVAREEFENDPLVLFHTTPMKNFGSIVEQGFRFGEIVKSVSYAYKSTSCLMHRGEFVAEDYAVFIVKFETLDQDFITKNILDIHVHNEDLQPEIIGYSIIPKEFVYR